MAATALLKNARTIGQPVDPIIEMNTTPLIDVMLVLLIMFIIIIPPQSHRVGLDLPGSIETLPLPVALKNEITLSSDGQAGWNGSRVSDSELKRLLAASAAMTTQPEIHFRPDPATRYERVDELLAIAAQSGVVRFGFAGNERYDRIF